MPRSRAVDPFASRRYRPAETGPPDPNDEPAGDLSLRLANAMGARLGQRTEVSEAEVLERLHDLLDEDATTPAPGPEVSPGSEGPGGGPEAHSDAQGPDGDPPVGWPNVSQAAEVLRVDPAEVRRRCREGELDARKDLSGAWRINPVGLTS